MSSARKCDRFFIRSIGVCALFVLMAARPSVATEIWFAPPDNLPRGTKLYNEDFPRLWTSPQEWSVTAKHISVFQITPYLAANAPEETLKEISAFLTARGISLAVAMQSVPVESCGRGVEGMTRPGTPLVIARRLKQFGLNVQWFSLDEPLEFGHRYNGAEACNYSVQEVAKRVGDTIRDLRSVYPAAKIVDSEVPAGPKALPVTQWSTILNEWLREYKSAVGTQFDAFIMDIYFRSRWPDAATATVQILRNHGIKAGIYLDSPGGPGVTDQSWMAETHKNISDVLAAGLNLDFVTIASWMQHPWRNLPETDPLALSSLVPWYLQKIGH